MNKHSGFFELLNEPLKIISQKGNLLAITITIYLITSYLIWFRLFTNFSLNPFVQNLMIKIFALVSTQPGTPEYTQLLVAIGIFLGNKSVYMVVFFLQMLFAQTSVTIIASSYYNGDSSSIIQHILKVSKAWTRPLVTWLYVLVLTLGYTSFFLLLFLVPSLVLFDHHAILITVLNILLSILCIAFYIHSSVVWSLAIVVSVVEEDSYGLQALGKARELVKGQRVHGFLLTLFYLLAVLVVLVFGSVRSLVMPIYVGVIQTLEIGVVLMFQFMAYAAFYFQCTSKNDMTKSGVLYKIIVLLNQLFGSKVTLSIGLNVTVSGSEITQGNWLNLIVSGALSTISKHYYLKKL